jgi:hypothetical protein
VKEGVALLTSRYNGKPVITGIVTACMKRLQQIEDAFWAMINAVQLANHPMAGGPWNVLDQIGAIVGAARNGLPDVDYLALIRLKATVNKSRGTPEDVINLGRIMAGAQPPGYLEMPPAAFYLVTLNINQGNYPQFTALLAQARPAAVYALLLYTITSSRGNDIWASRYDASTANQRGWGSRYDSVVGGKLAAAVQI